MQQVRLPTLQILSFVLFPTINLLITNLFLSFFQSMLLLFDSAEKVDGVIQTKRTLCKDWTGQSDR